MRKRGGTMILNKPLITQCKHCGEIIEIDTDLECVFSQERSMGVESQYEGVIDDVCPNCSNKISISIDVWEYPVGAIETYSIDTNGIELIESPDFICEDFY